MGNIIRVLHVVAQMNRNGLESRIMDIYRNIDRTKVQFDFLVHNKKAGSYDNEIEKLGGKIYRISALNPIHFVSYLKTLNNFFNSHSEYRVVHAHLNSYSSWVLWYAKKTGVPVRIAHSRNSGWDYNWKFIFKYFSKLFINIPTTHKFACSKQAGEWLFGKKGITYPNYFKVIPNGFDIEKFQYDSDIRRFKRQELGLSENQMAMVIVGRLVPQKNHKFLFNVFKKCLLAKPDAMLYLIGNGPLKENLQKLAISLGINKHVVFVGNIPNVYDYLQAMDIKLLPSVYEGFGTVVIESQCIGLPTIASDVLPPETQITECLKFMSISKNTPQEWADASIELYHKIERKQRHEEVKFAGYDIKDSYKSLFEFYINNYEK